MGRIFKACDRLSGRFVALKVVFREDFAQRFLRESALLAELNHPAVVKYVCHGRTAAGDPYLAMEWLDGEDLQHLLDRYRQSARMRALHERRPPKEKELEATVSSKFPIVAAGTVSVSTTAEPALECLARRGLSVAEAMLLARRIGSALAELHRRNLVHRDVKPANIMSVEKPRIAVRNQPEKLRTTV